MSTLKTVTPPEQFLVQVNGVYNIIFDELTITVSGALPAGTILESTSEVVDSESAVVLGILVEAKAAGSQKCRVMVRGNPSTVNRRALAYGTGVVATINALLAAKGILVVNV